MGPNGLVFILVVGACRAVGWEKLGGWYGDQLVTYLVHKGESQVASPVFQCGPPKVVPQQSYYRRRARKERRVAVQGGQIAEITKS